MNAISVFTTALEYERKIRDLYATAVATVDDERGKAIFATLAKEEQSHIDFLKNSIDTLQNNGSISAALLETAIPDNETIKKQTQAMRYKIPDHMLGDVKRVLSSALQMEIETTDFYRDAFDKTDGAIKEILGKFVEIEKRHTDVVRFELDYASRNGFWFGFMEKSMEVGW